MKKGIIFVIIIGILIVLSTLALVALHLMTQESRITEHKVRRIRAIFTARAAMVHALEELRNGNAVDGDTITLNGLDATIEIDPGAGPMGTDVVDITVDYRT